MGKTTDLPRGMSAAQANKPIKPAKKKAPDGGQRVFTIKRDGQVVAQGTFHEIKTLFPGVKESVVLARLNRGDREFDRLARPVEKPQGRKRRLRPIPMFNRKKARDAEARS